MAMNRARFRRQLQEGLNTVFGLAYRRYPEEWRQIFSVETSRKAYEEDVLMVGLAGAQVKAEGAGVAYDAGAESWVARYHHDTIALAFAITEEAEEDGLYGRLGAKYARALARSLQHTKEVKGAAILNNGFNSSYPGGDGVELFSLAHPLWNGGVLKNEPDTPADLSEEALEDALIRISEWTDDRGIPVNVMAKALILPPELIFEGARLKLTELRPGTADNDINATKALGMVPEGCKVNHRLTDPDSWFLTSDAEDGLKHMSRLSVRRGVEGDFNTGNMRYKARERYSFGWTDPRGAFGVPSGG
jgi:hypothetical protein